MRADIKTGMKVVSADGHKLGKVTSLEADGFIIEKGLYFPRDHLARYVDVAVVQGDEIKLSVNRDALLELEDRAKLEERGEWAPRGAVPGGESPAVPQPNEAIRVPELQDEEVIAERRRREDDSPLAEQRAASDAAGRGDKRRS